MARIQSMAETFAIAQQSTLKETHDFLVATAKREHAKVMQEDPRPASFTRYVDGQQGAREEQVKPNGLIFYEYPRLPLVANAALDVLIEKSPVASGDYRNSHTLFLNGSAVKDLSGWKSGDEVVISNFIAYARKIEAGFMTMRVAGSDHVYEQTRQIVQARYGNLARVDFTYRGIEGGGLSRGRPGKSGARYPALVIRER